MTIRGRGARRPWHWLLALALLLSSGGAMALGLGQIRVLSAPGEPLLAEIPIISNEPGELENARARLASPETFARVGLQAPTGLVRDLQFEITTDARDRAVVRVTSSAPVDVPALAFLVEVDWGQGRLVREYSALVDGPRTATAIEAPVIEAP
ncbi:MAG TPA: ferrous iron transporter B, partial [Pseudoxanthomonas sp.]|nr:ferrous iron transporter B [Pseudoxanthomonas sp.]